MGKGSWPIIMIWFPQGLCLLLTPAVPAAGKLHHYDNSDYNFIIDFYHIIINFYRFIINLLALYHWFFITFSLIVITLSLIFITLSLIFITLSLILYHLFIDFYHLFTESEPLYHRLWSLYHWCYYRMTVLAKDGESTLVMIIQNRKSSSWSAGKICHHRIVCNGWYISSNCCFTNIAIRFECAIIFCNGWYPQLWCHQHRHQILQWLVHILNCCVNNIATRFCNDILKLSHKKLPSDFAMVFFPSDLNLPSTWWFPVLPIGQKLTEMSGLCLRRWDISYSGKHQKHEWENDVCCPLKVIFCNLHGYGMWIA